MQDTLDFRGVSTRKTFRGSIGLYHALVNRYHAFRARLLQQYLGDGEPEPIAFVAPWEIASKVAIILRCKICDGGDFLARLWGEP